MSTIRHGRRQLRYQTNEVLDSLGSDPVEVARRLREVGVRGTPGNSRECAIAVYLSAVVAADPGVRSLKVRAESVILSPERKWSPPIVVGLSPALRAFVEGFDRRIYPELVRKEGRGLGRGERATPHGSP